MFLAHRTLLFLVALIAYLSVSAIAFDTTVGATTTSPTTTKAKRGRGIMKPAPANKPAAVVARQVVPDAAAQKQAKAAKRNLQPVKRAEPSSRYGRKKRAKVEKKAEKKDYSSFLCPGGSVACPAPVVVKAGSAKGVVERTMTPDELSRQLNSLADWFKIGFECMELDNELNSCGGCVTLGSGQDCTTIPSARKTGCEQGVCQVYQCREGYVVSPDRTSCIQRGNAAYVLADEQDEQTPFL